jgi:transcriptional regulator with XRE-family HTH domain
MDIGKKVKELLDDFHLRPADLSRKTGIDPAYLSRLLHGKARWNQDQIMAISQAFDVNPIDLLDDISTNRNYRNSRSQFDGILNLEILTLAIRLTEEFLGEKRLSINPDRKSRLISKLYEHYLIEKEMPTQEHIKIYFLLT